MKEIIAELDYENVGPSWAIKPVFWAKRDNEDDKTSVVIQLFHRCRKKSAREPQKLIYCGMTNREDFKKGFFPEYECSACSEKAPAHVIEKKLLAQTKYEGHDPLNNRRAAVLATKEKRKV